MTAGHYASVAKHRMATSGVLQMERGRLNLAQDLPGNGRAVVFWVCKQGSGQKQNF